MNSAILRNSGIAFLLMSALSRPVPAEAQQGAPSSAAQLEFDHGNAAFQAGNWSSAIEHYSQALNSSSDPRIVKNLALAYDNAGERELLAICYYHAFLEVRPRDPDVGKLRARIPELELTVESRMRALAEQLEKVVEKLPSEVGRMWFDTSLEKARTLAARAFAAIGDLPRAERIASATKVPSSVYLDIVSLQLQTFDFHGASRLLSNLNDWTQVPFLVHSIPRPNLFSFRDSEAADALAFIHSLEEELDRYFQWYEPSGSADKPSDITQKFKYRGVAGSAGYQMLAGYLAIAERYFYFADYDGAMAVARKVARADMTDNQLRLETLEHEFAGQANDLASKIAQTRQNPTERAGTGAKQIAWEELARRFIEHKEFPFLTEAPADYGLFVDRITREATQAASNTGPNIDPLASIEDLERGVEGLALGLLVVRHQAAVR